MTTTLQIEQRLAALSGAGFQRLSDAYLRQRGIESYLSIGLTLGRAKTRIGTPDALATDANGYTFVEATTQKEGLGAKLVDDVSKCLDPDKTGVPIAEIRRIYLFFTGHLDAAEVEALYALTRPFDIELSLCGPHELADDLRYRFASLAQEYLGLAIDTGQVLDPETFVQRHSNTAIQSDLDAPLVGRADDLTALAAHLGDATGRPTVLLTGASGVGKTRLALEAVRRARIMASPATVLCVRSRRLEAAVDLRAALERPGRYLILFDDANRLVNLAGLLDIALEPQDDREVRVLLTARDYVAEDIRRLLRERGDTKEVTVPPLDDGALRDLLIGTFNIQNHQYQRRILEIAAGNPRLAVMAAHVALRSEDLSQLHDATDVYRRFFDPLRDECPILTTSDGLRTLGSVALVGQLDLNQTELSSAVARLHRLDAATFRVNLEALEDLELVDTYENEVVRVSDQTLSAYILFLALFDRSVLSLTDALLELYPRAREALLEALGGVVRAFRGEDVLTHLNAAVDTVWDRAARDWPTELFNSFVFSFADARPAEALDLALAQLRARPGDPAPTERVVVPADSQASVNDSATLLLGRFRSHDSLREIALAEIIAEARRRPSRIPELLGLAWESYGFSPDSEWARLTSEHALVDLFWKDATDDEQIAAVMFLGVAEHALRTEHNSASAGRGHSIVVTRFHLPNTQAVRALRNNLWHRLVELLSIPTLKPAVRKVIASYAGGGLQVQDRDIVSDDLATLEPLLLALLDSGCYEDLALVRLLMQVRRRFDLGTPTSYAQFLSCPPARMAELLLRDPTETGRSGWRGEAARRAARLQRLGESVGAKRLAEFGAELETMIVAHTDHEAYQIREGATMVLTAAAATKPDAVTALVRRWIAEGNPLKLPPGPLLTALTRATNERATRDLVTSAAPSPLRDPWVAAWLQLLPADTWTPEHAQLADEVLRQAPRGEVLPTRDILDRICAVDAARGLELLRHLAERIPAEPALAWALSFEFYDDSVLATDMGAVLRAHPSVFGDLYLALGESDRDIDPHAVVLNELLLLDPRFGGRWVDRMGHKARRPSFDDHRDYTILWLRDDWAEVLGLLARQILSVDDGAWFAESFLGPILRMPDGTIDQEAVVERQDTLLTELIREVADDADRRERLFRGIAQLPAARRRVLIGVCLGLEPPVDEFVILTLEQTSWGWSGSEVPLLEDRRAFFESLLPLCNRTTLLPHRAKIEEWLRYLDRDIARARSRDFREQQYVR